MWKTCSKCGLIHSATYICPIRKPSKGRTEDQRLRSTSKWQDKSKEIREKSNYLCAICKLENRYTYQDVEVHHIEKLKDAPEKLLDNYNLVCLCKYHHELADAGKIKAATLLELAKRREEAE